MSIELTPRSHIILEGVPNSDNDLPELLVGGGKCEIATLLQVRKKKSQMAQLTC